MSASRIAAVIGATGQQGSSVIRSLLRDRTFTPRAITRDLTSPAALNLEQQGVEIVKADAADKASLVNALRGSEALFVATVSTFPPYSAEKPSEVTLGKNIIDAAREVGVKFIVLSSVPGLKKLSGGKYSQVSIYEDKAEIEDYLKSSGVPNASLHLGTFLENMWTRGGLKKSSSSPSSYTISAPFFTPTTINSFTWVGHDVGEAALALMKNYNHPTTGAQISGKAYPVVTANISFSEFAEKVSKALGREVTFATAPPMGHPVYDGMYEALAEYQGFYTSTPVPNPDLVALGAKFGTVEELVETEIKKRFSD
ncbi:NmrA domain-containing protein [Favolaschia claudopus]|uniref:NmrA domain-containing protein n=1 Tax=Favolaschia claudopus TaxID=2862362 RepID=A0AAW0CPQ0_9AGAR